MHAFNLDKLLLVDVVCSCVLVPYRVFNGRGWVNFVDFAMLTLYWIEADCDLGDLWYNIADFTRNGEVNLDDLAKFITYRLIGVE